MFFYIKKSMYKSVENGIKNMNYVIIHILQKEKGRENGYIFSTGTLSIVTLIKRRDNFIRYTADITMLYFLSYLCAGSFDMSLSLYAVFLIAGSKTAEDISWRYHNRHLNLSVCRCWNCVSGCIYDAGNGCYEICVYNHLYMYDIF